MTIDDIRAVLRNPAAAFKALAGAVTDARTIASAAEADLAALNARRPDVVLNGSDKDLAKLDEVIAAASRTAERARALAEACDVKAAGVKAAEVERARVERYAAAEAVLAAVPATIGDDWRAATALFHGILDRLARVDVAVAAVNADLPEGKPPLPSAESFRQVPPTPAQEIASDVFWLYCEDNGQPLDNQARAKPRPNGMGWAGEYARTDAQGRPVQWGTVEVLVKRLPFRDVTTTRPQHFRNPGPLASELAIPPLFGETTPGWHPAPGITPTAVLASLPGCDAPLSPMAPLVPETVRRRVTGPERDALMAQLLAGEIA